MDYSQKKLEKWVKYWSRDAKYSILSPKQQKMIDDLKQIQKPKLDVIDEVCAFIKNNKRPPKYKSSEIESRIYTNMYKFRNNQKIIEQLNLIDYSLQTKEKININELEVHEKIKKYKEISYTILGKEIMKYIDTKINKYIDFLLSFLKSQEELNEFDKLSIFIFENGRLPYFSLNENTVESQLRFVYINLDIQKKRYFIATLKKLNKNIKEYEAKLVFNFIKENKRIPKSSKVISTYNEVYENDLNSLMTRNRKNVEIALKENNIKLKDMEFSNVKIKSEIILQHKIAELEYFIINNKRLPKLQDNIDYYNNTIKGYFKRKYINEFNAIKIKYNLK